MNGIQLKLIDWETPREATERRHKEYVARFRREHQEARRKGLEARHKTKLQRDEPDPHGISTKLTFGW